VGDISDFFHYLLNLYFHFPYAQTDNNQNPSINFLDFIINLNLLLLMTQGSMK